METKARRYALALIALFAATTANSQTWYDYRDQTWDHTKAGDFFTEQLEISTPEQLAQLAWLVNEQGLRFKNKTIILREDIDLDKTVNGKRVEWVPIGQKDTQLFEGIFIGYKTSNGQLSGTHTISGMYINGGYPRVSQYVGLFGHCSGFIGYITLDSPEISFTNAYGYWVNIGTVCGMLDGSDLFAIRSAGHTSGIIPCAIRGVTVRNAKVTVSGTDYGALGGIVGLCKGYGVSHSTMTGTITANSTISTGGVAGLTETGTATDSEHAPAITDCTVQATIISQSNSTVGGIVGNAKAGTVVNACSAMGTITNRQGQTGGIVGLQEAGTTISGCSATTTITAAETVGGIVGLMQKADTGTSKIEHCAYSGHIDASAATAAGGLCGKMEWEKNEHLTDCLFLGTMSMPANKANCSATVGSNKDAEQTVSVCYYDKNLFGGNVVPGKSTHITCEGLITTKLTSGKTEDVPLLNIGNGNAGFTLSAGFYPMAYSRAPWTGYSACSVYGEGDNDVWNALFSKQRSENSNYQVGAWLCSLPVSMERGDVAYDFVSTVTAIPFTSDLTLDDGRAIKLTSTTAFPVSPAIKVSGSKAKAVGQGSGLMTLGTVCESAVTYHDRPQLVNGTKQLLLNAAMGMPWDGSTATALDFGNGTAQDPFVIRNAAQLAYAVNHNSEGEFYEQLCDIILNENLLSGDNGYPDYKKLKWVKTTTWSAHYDGAGHIIYGAFIDSDEQGLFGDVGSNGEIANLGVAESTFSRGASGMLARHNDGHIYNCFVQGLTHLIQSQRSLRAKAYGYCESGGICSTVGLNNPHAVVEDCISALYNARAYCDYTPFVSLNEGNRGVVRHCLSVVPVYYANTDWTDLQFSAAGHDYIQDCYWLRGYEPMPTGQTLDEIGQALGSRSCWQWTRGYFPTLKSFADTDIAKLMMLPMRTDKRYDGKSDADFLLGFDHLLEFEPGGAVWTLTGNKGAYVDADGEMGIITPLRASIDPAYKAQPTDRGLYGLVFLKGTLGRSSIMIPMQTTSAGVSQGITFIDQNARQACLQAFDADGNGWLSLAEVKAVTPESVQTAFQTATARNIRLFPELRFFKGITRLDSQLNGLTRLEQVQLPYALQTLGSEAFRGCDLLKKVTLPAKLSRVEPRAFYDSAVDSIFVDMFNTRFESRDGILLTTDNHLVAFPNGRVGEECTVSGTVNAIDEGAVYKVKKLRQLYFDTTDYTTVPRLAAGSIVTEDGSLMDVYVSDATEDQSLIAAYRRAASWADYVAARKLHTYFPLKIDDRLLTTDAEGRQRYVSTMCIGFDTELPPTLTPYIVAKADRDHYTAYLTEMQRRVPATAAVVIHAERPGLYRLSPLDEELEPWPLYENRLVGTSRDGLPLNQATSAQGSIMTPDYNADHSQVGFFYDRTKEVPPYRAYLPYNTVGIDKDMARNAHYDMAYTWLAQQPVTHGGFLFKTYQNQLDGSGRATLVRYKGDDHHVAVPPAIAVPGGQADVTHIEPYAFYQSKWNIWSIDMSGLERMDYVKSDRDDEDSPFWNLENGTILYLPEDKAAPGDNVVVGNKCRRLTLTDGWSFQPPVEFSADEVILNREFCATRNGDGWRSCAYTVSLPFDAECPAGATLYQLRGISEDSRQAVFAPTGNNGIKAWEPYLMVVGEGSFSLSASDVYISPAGDTGATVGAWPATTDSPIARWQATRATVDATTAERQQTYVLQSDGTFKQVLADYADATVPSFRAVFNAEKRLQRMCYMVCLEHSDGSAELLGADDYTADAAMRDYGRFDNDLVPVAVWTAGNRTLTFTVMPYTTKPGDSFSKQTVTAVWRDRQVTETGTRQPQWTSEAYAREATSVVFDDSFAKCELHSLYAWFKDMSRLTVIDLSGLTLYRVADARQLFAGCSSLTTVFCESSPFLPDTPSDGMFEGCTSLKGASAYAPELTNSDMANAEFGYLTYRPYVVWCADTQTLHFLTFQQTIEAGDSYGDGTVTQTWHGLQVYDVGWNRPAWNSVGRDVRHVVFDRSFSIQRPKSLYAWFFNFQNLERIDGLEHLNTSETTNFNSTFLSCVSLKTLYVNAFDMSRATNTSAMFRECRSLTTIWCDHQWDIADSPSNAMFSLCFQLAGAASYDSDKSAGDMANPETGYFTRVPRVDFADLADNSELLQRYDGQIVHATYKHDRKFSAIQNADGTWTSRAYSLCLPFTVDVYRQAGNYEDVNLYYLQHITRNHEFVFKLARFRREIYTDDCIEAGYPYLVVVNKGTLRLEENNALITATPVDMKVKAQAGGSDDHYELCGYWKGTFGNISNDDAAGMMAHTLSNDGKFRRISNAEGYRGAYIGTFRAFFSPFESDDYWTWTPTYLPDTQGITEENPIRDFPVDSYEGDDASLFPTAVKPVIHTIDPDGTHRYFDLQGRPLSTPPTKGVYIDNGIKRMNKK